MGIAPLVVAGIISGVASLGGAIASGVTGRRAAADQSRAQLAAAQAHAAAIREQARRNETIARLQRKQADLTTKRLLYLGGGLLGVVLIVSIYRGL